MWEEAVDTEFASEAFKVLQTRDNGGRMKTLEGGSQELPSRLLTHVGYRQGMDQE